LGQNIRFWHASFRRDAIIRRLSGQSRLWQAVRPVHLWVHGLDTVGDWEEDFRPYGIRASINHMVIGEVITRYTLLYSANLGAVVMRRTFDRARRKTTNDE
jgi:hypothetical protein